MICRWAPGERMAYSNVNYTILGYLIYHLSGQAWDVYLQDQILEPLNMQQTHFSPGVRDKATEVREYIRQNGEFVAVPQAQTLNPPAGSLWSGATDMLKFVQCLLREGDSVFSAKLIQEFETHQSLPIEKGGSYAKGNSLVTLFSKHAFIGHGGLTGTCFSALGYNRELGMGFVVSANSNQPVYRFVNRITAWMTEGLPSPDFIQEPLDADAIQPWLGHYSFKSPRNQIAAIRDHLLNHPVLYVEKGHLYVKNLLQPTYELIQAGPGQFRWAGANTPTVFLRKNAEGHPIFYNAGGYHEQTAAWKIYLKQGAVLLAALLLVSAILWGLFSFLSFFRGKLKGTPLLIRQIPLLALGGLGLAIWQLLEVESYTYLLLELRDINVRTLTIFLGSGLFGVLSFLYVFLAGRRLLRGEKGRMRRYEGVVGVAMVGLTLFLASYGWIALRTWAQ